MHFSEYQLSLSRLDLGLSVRCRSSSGGIVVFVKTPNCATEECNCVSGELKSPILIERSLEQLILHCFLCKVTPLVWACVCILTKLTFQSLLMKREEKWIGFSCLQKLPTCKLSLVTVVSPPSKMLGVQLQGGLLSLGNSPALRSHPR